jgi:hypothetical protein
MSNSRTTYVNYKPRYTQMEAYDLLPEEIRDALKEGPQEWDTGSVLRRYQKSLKTKKPSKAKKEVIASLVNAHEDEIVKGLPWRPRKPGQKWEDIPPSPHVQAKATMQLSNGPLTTSRKIPLRS